MIKINLLPIRAARRREALRRQVLGGVASIVLIIICLYLTNQVKTHEIHSLVNKINYTKQEIDRLKEIIAEVDLLKAKKKELEDKKDIISKLEAAKIGPVRVLEELGFAVTKTLWLTSLNEKEGLLELKGSAMDNDAIADFLTNLEKSIYFKDVRLKETTSFVDKENKVTLKKFVITAKVDYGAEG